MIGHTIGIVYFCLLIVQQQYPCLMTDQEHVKHVIEVIGRVLDSNQK